MERKEMEKVSWKHQKLGFYHVVPSISGGFAQAEPLKHIQFKTMESGAGASKNHQTSANRPGQVWVNCGFLGPLSIGESHPYNSQNITYSKSGSPQ